MSLSPSLRRALGDNSGYVRGQLGQSSVKTQISNAKSRLSAVGVDPEEGKNNQNFLLKTLDILARPGYAGANMLREFTSQNKGVGETPDTFDPFAAFARGLTGKEKTTGKDIFTDQGMSGDTGIFGGEAKWYNPSAAGALGLALDIFNPLDVTNWIGFGVGDDIIKGTSRGTRALTDAFGATKAAQISDLLMSSAKSVDDVTDAVRASGKALNASKTLDDLGADTVGNLIRQISGKVDSVDKVQQLNNLISEGLLETGKDAATKLDYRALKPLSIGLQNPLSITPIGSVKLPGYKATKGAAKLPLVAPGKDFAGTFVNIPGSEYLTNAISKVTQKVAESSVGQALGKMFSTAFVPNTVPSSVVMRNMTINNLDDLVDIAKTVPDNVPLSVDELMTLRDELAQVTVSNTFDFADNFSASQLKQVNKGNYFSVQELAKRVKLKNFSTDEILSVLNDAPFTKTIPELYDSLRTMKPQTDAKSLFNGAAKLRKVMDLMYEQIPEGAKPFFTGVLKSQLSDLYPSEITSKRLGKNLSSSPLMAYEFNYKGVPISVVVNSGEDFNLDPWAKLSSTFEAMDELPEESIQALKAQVDISPVPIKNPDTSMTIGNTVVLGRIDKPTVAHEFGHLWDSVAGDPESYSKAILSDSQKIDNTITPDDLYSDYARSLYSTNNTIGLKEDFADSISDYLKDRKMFSQSYPGRTSEIERILGETSVPKEELAKMVSKQRAIAEQVSQIPRAEEQIRQMLDSVDQYSRKIATLSGDKAYQSFKQSLSALYEQTNWKTKQWQQQVDELFRGIGKEERKQIMDAAAQITGTEIPGRAKSMAQPMFADMASQDSTLKFNQITRAWKESWTPYYEVRQRLLRPGELDVNPQRTYRGAEPGRYRVPTDDKASKYPKHIFEVVDRKTGEVVTSVASYTSSPPTQTAAMIKAFERNPELATKYGIEPSPKLRPLSSNSFSEPLFADNPGQAHLFRLRDAKESGYTTAHPRYGYFFTESLDDLEGWKFELLDNWVDDYDNAEIVEGLYNVSIKEWDDEELQTKVYKRLLKAGFDPKEWILKNYNKTSLEKTPLDAHVRMFKEDFYDGSVTINEVLDMMKFANIPDDQASKILGGKAFRSALNEDFGNEVFILGKPKPAKEALHPLPKGKDVDWNKVSFPESVEPLFADKFNRDVEKLFSPLDRDEIPVYHIATPEQVDSIMADGKFPTPRDGVGKSDMSNRTLFFAPDPQSSYRWTEQVGIEGNYSMIRGTINTKGLNVVDLDSDIEKIYRRGLELGIPKSKLKPVKDYDSFAEYMGAFEDEDVYYSSAITALVDWAEDVGFKGRESQLLGDVVFSSSAAEKEIGVFNPSVIGGLQKADGSEIDKIMAGPGLIRNPDYQPGSGGYRFMEDPNANPLDYGPEAVKKKLFSIDKEQPLFAQQNFPVFMSRLEEATSKMPNAMPVDQFKAYLKSHDVKDDEMKWAFLDELLDGKTKVSKTEVQDWVKGNKLEVQEVWKTNTPTGITRSAEIVQEYGIEPEGFNNQLTEFYEAGLDQNAVNREVMDAFDISEQEAIDLISYMSDPEVFNEMSQGLIVPADQVDDLVDDLMDTGIEAWPDTLSSYDADPEMSQRLVNYWTTHEDTLTTTSLKEYLNRGIENPTRFARHTQPGGEGYTELVFTLPLDYNISSSQKAIRESMAELPDDYELARPEVPEASFKYIPHWEEDNPIAHARFDTRYTEDGRKVLFIDEIQSDWHQQGRDYGYRPLGMDKEGLYRQERDKLAKLRSDYYDESQYTELNWSERMHKIGEIDQQIRQLEDKLEDTVADAPFKTNWDEFVQKRLLRYAADNGYDGIAWSTGKQQAERWGQTITDSIDTIQYNQEGKTLRAYKNGEQVIYQKVEPNELPRLVGSDVAKKLLDTTPDTFTIKPVDSPSSYDLYEQKALQDTEGMDPVAMSRYLDKNQFDGGNRGFKVYDQNGNAWSYVYPTEHDAQKAIEDLATVGETVKTVSGTNITVGGEGMRKFYDQQVPSNFKKLGKRFGLTIEDIGLDFSGAKGLNMALQDEEGILDSLLEFTEELGTNTVDDSALSFNIGWYITSEYETGAKFTEADVDQLVSQYTRVANKLSGENDYDVVLAKLSPSKIKESVIEQITEAGVELSPKSLSKQRGIWLSPESRTKITQQSFPLFADNTKAPVDNLTQGWSERQITALDNFLKWRNSVVKQYRQIGIPINELEKYVPFIPERVLNKKEAEVLRNTFGTGVKDAGVDNFDTFMAGITRADPNLKKRTTGATRPSEVNKILKKNWLTEDAAIAMNIRGQRAIKAQELNTFVDEFVDTYGLRASDLAELAGNTVPDGYNAYRVGIDSTGNKVLEMVNNVPKDVVKGTEVIFLPDEMAKLYNEYQGLMLNKGKKNGLLRVYDSLSSLYKKAAYLWNPGHIMRDFQGNVFNNYLMGVVDPSEYAEGLKAFRKAEGVLQTPKGDIEYSKIYEQAQKLGIVDSVMAHELPLTNAKPEGGYSKLMRSATYATDGWTRMTGFIHNLKQGQSFAEAATTTKKYLFDYFDLTPFERKVMRRIIPFYTFMRKNIPLQFKTLVTDPRIFARIGKIQNAIAGGPIDWEDKPEYIQDTGAIQPLGSDFYVGNTLPFQDLAKIPMGLDMDAMGSFLSSVNPLIRAPIESMTNQDWWTGDKLEDYAGEQVDIPVLSSLLRALGSKDNLTVSARTTGNLLDNIPILSRADDLLNVATGQETNDSRTLSRVSTTMGGPSVYGASSVERSADWQERQRLLDLIRLLQDQGVEIPNASQLKQDSRYGRLKRILGGK